MATSKNTPRPPTNPTLVTSASLVLPGLGQFILHKRWRGLLILLATAVLAFLINWSAVHQKVGLVTIGGIQTSWLWLPLIMFWIWNLLDARAINANKTLTLLPGILFAALILYVIAWNVTEVRFDRLIERFGDARVVAMNLLNPDVFTISVNAEDKICDWGCMYTYLGDRFAGRLPAGTVRISDNMLDIFGKMKMMPAPSWQVSLGLAAKGSKVNTFIAGSLIETIAMGLMATLFSTILAIPVSFLAAHNIMSRVPGGTAIYYVVRTLLNVVRAVDTIVWGLIVIVWVGLGSFAGVIALTIHSVASLGKLFSEEIEHVDPGPIEAVSSTGANLIQTVRYAVIPQIVPSFLAYALLRWDINMRSATIIGFVAGGGIGFFVVETTRQGAYQQYATALWAVAAVIILVDYISAKWRENILKDQSTAERENKKRSKAGNLLIAFYVLLGLIVFMYGWSVTEISL